MKDLRHGNNLYRSCLSKRRYKTYRRALLQAQKFTEKFGKEQYVYWCSYCNGYHITSTPRKVGQYGTIDELRTGKIKTEETQTQKQNESEKKNAEIISQEEQE